FFFFKQKTAYEMVGSDWSSDVCSSDLRAFTPPLRRADWPSSFSPKGIKTYEIGRASCRGKSVTNRVDLGGRRIIKKKKNKKTKQEHKKKKQETKQKKNTNN